MGEGTRAEETRAEETREMQQRQSNPGQSDPGQSNPGQTQPRHPQPRHPQPAAAEIGGWDDGLSYIDTTYMTQEVKTDPTRYGFGCLIISLVLSGFLAGFGGLYGYLLMNGKMAAFESMGQMFPSRDIWVWTGCAGLGLIFNLIAVGTKKWTVSVLAFLAYAAAAAVAGILLRPEPIYYYIGLTAVQALLCLIAGIRKGSGKR